MQSAHRQREKKVEKYGRILIEISNKTWIIVILWLPVLRVHVFQLWLKNNEIEKNPINKSF